MQNRHAGHCTGLQQPCKAPDKASGRTALTLSFTLYPSTPVRRLQEAAEREREIRAAQAELNDARAQLSARAAEVRPCQEAGVNVLPVESAQISVSLQRQRHTCRQCACVAPVFSCSFRALCAHRLRLTRRSCLALSMRQHGWLRSARWWLAAQLSWQQR